MNSRERLLTVLRGAIPDCVPVMPDTSNMIPARLTGKPFWDLYLYNDPPIWEAYSPAPATSDSTRSWTVTFASSSPRRFRPTRDGSVSSFCATRR